MPKWVFERKNFRRPDVQLEHVDALIRFYEDRVEAWGRLTLTAGKRMSAVELDFNGGKIEKPIGREVNPGERFEVEVENTFVPSDTDLYGIYRDTTPSGAPQQYMSQCQQFGFQRILPVVDDCTAKCTFRTRLEGDARYTHLISNGDLVESGLLEGGDRKFVVYENRERMAPYLFIACAGTWEVLADEVEYQDTHQIIKLEYLVPPGCIEGARIPMTILKDSILWQHEVTGFVYPYSVYRTITMDKSLYGGMENTGNTTIITEAALIDETIGDRRLVYAHGVIPHEYEHSHCGSGVTMESVFDMWLNEAYTVNIERAYVARIFGEAFSRSMELADLRATGGAFAEEDAGTSSPVVREGVNDPDEVVDAITYDKAPEVLNTLRNLIGEDAYNRAWREYFHRFAGGNANTDDFVKIFSEVSGCDISSLIGTYLFKTGYPVVDVDWTWQDGTLNLVAEVKGDFIVPVTWTAVKNGIDVAGGKIKCSANMQTKSTIALAERPDFISWNRGGGFYGILKDRSATCEILSRQVRSDLDSVNRAEAMRNLTDLARRDRTVAETWLDVYEEVFASDTFDVELKSELLKISEYPVDRTMLGRVRENVEETRHLRMIAASRLGMPRIEAALRNLSPAYHEMTPQGIVERSYARQLLTLAAAIDTADAWMIMEEMLATARNITARLDALKAIISSGNPRRDELLEMHGYSLRNSQNGYIGYLDVVASNPHEEVFARVAAEEAREGWSIKHPGLSRALFLGLSRNNTQIWTSQGLAWMESTLVRYARTSEYNALRLLAPLENYRTFAPDLSAEVRKVLENVNAELTSDNLPAIRGRLSRLLA